MKIIIQKMERYKEDRGDWIDVTVAAAGVQVDAVFHVAVPIEADAPIPADIEERVTERVRCLLREMLDDEPGAQA